MTNEAKAVEDALSAFAAAVLVRLRETVGASWEEPGRVHVTTMTKVRGANIITRMDVVILLPATQIVVSREFGSQAIRIRTGR